MIEFFYLVGYYHIFIYFNSNSFCIGKGRSKKKMKRLDMLLRDEIEDLTLPSRTNAFDNDDNDDSDDIHVGVGGYEDDDMDE